NIIKDPGIHQIRDEIVNRAGDFSGGSDVTENTITFISQITGHNIIVMETKTGDAYTTVRQSFIYSKNPNTPTVFIYYTTGHYEAMYFDMGINSEFVLVNYFKWCHPIIDSIINKNEIPTT